MPGLRFALIVSLFWHILMFGSVEFTFGKQIIARPFDLTKIFFLGPVLDRINIEGDADNQAEELSMQIPPNLLRQKTSEAYRLIPKSNLLKKPAVSRLIDIKAVYFQPVQPIETKKADSSIIFYPPLPYHFLLYFSDRQAAHMEVSFYVSDKGTIAGLKRKISSGNPEVDLLIMRNLNHFLNLCKTNFSPNSWQTVKIDLKP
ncbi:MAG: hypothetical protein ABIC18_01495 [Candidatus Omnitrophota bacterium]